MIQHLTHEQIDKTKWDLCVQQCTNVLPYAFSWYLDRVSPGWEALVSGDYESVMPLTWKKKWGIKYLYQPFFTQQLGVFFKSKETQQEVIHFIRAIPKSYRFIDIHLNSENHFEHLDFKLRKRKNYILQLNKPYDKIAKGYDKHCLRNVKKAKRFNHFIKPAEPSDIIEFYKKHKGLETKNVGKSDYAMLEQLCKEADKQKMMMAYGVYNDSEELLAGGLFLLSANRVIYLLGTASAKGKESRAMYALIDYMLMQRCGFQVVFDFEGSEIPGIARFFKGFGAEKETYYKFKLNHLPRLIRWLK
jgi:hypothetical protein